MTNKACYLSAGKDMDEAYVVLVSFLVSFLVVLALFLIECDIRKDVKDPYL